MSSSQSLPKRDIFFITGLIHSTVQTAALPGFSPEPNNKCYICWGLYGAPRSSAGAVNADSRSPCKIAICGHWFCYSCLHEWLQEQRNSCPVCRRELFQRPAEGKNIEDLDQELQHIQTMMQQMLARESSEYLYVAMCTIDTLRGHICAMMARISGQSRRVLDTRNTMIANRSMRMKMWLESLFEIQGPLMRSTPSSSHSFWSKFNNAAPSDADMVRHLETMLYAARYIDSGAETPMIMEN